MSTPSAKGASVGRFCQPGHGRPVQIDLLSIQLGGDLSSLLDVFLNDPLQDLSPVSGAVDLLFPTREIDRACVAARLTLDTACKAIHQGLPEGPIIVMGKQFSQSVEKALNPLILLGLAFRLGNSQSRYTIKGMLELVPLFIREGLTS